MWLDLEKRILLLRQPVARCRCQNHHAAAGICWRGSLYYRPSVQLLVWSFFPIGLEPLDELAKALGCGVPAVVLEQGHPLIGGERQRPGSGQNDVYGSADCRFHIVESQ